MHTFGLKYMHIYILWYIHFICKYNFDVHHTKSSAVAIAFFKTIFTRTNDVIVRFFFPFFFCYFVRNFKREGKTETKKNEWIFL